MSEVAKLEIRNLVHVRRQGDIEAELEKRFEDAKEQEWNLDGLNPSFSTVWPLEWDEEELLKNSEVDDISPYAGE